MKPLNGDHQDALHVARVDRRGCPNDAHVIMAKGGEEVLGDGAIVAELRGLVADVVPTLHRDRADLLEHRVPIQRLKGRIATRDQSIRWRPELITPCDAEPSD